MPNDIKIGINISDGGTGEKVNKIAKEIKNTLEGAAAAAKRVPEALAAAQQGVAATNAMRSPSPAKATRAPTGINSDELKDYGTARGISGATGAASRDFAKQAQGLGGLVHVYATFAANLFAVSAAFSALSKAADTTNMVKGLDQLSVSSGHALGNLSKQLSQVTDGAISMRDAMTATVSASAGGMTNAAILRMGNVAKQASQALGVAMPDALNRISRGITKLEPELLDEIGIMVRVDKTSQDYARTLGKTASALTDFEKRQGFANAVLEQGEKKFGNIKIDANPYAKILASMENIAQTGLELVNKVLSPMLTILSSSPLALATAMGLVASILLKQALPAIGSFKEGLREAADQAKLLALTRASEAQKGYKAAAVAETTAMMDQARKTYEITKANAEQIAEEKVAAVVRAETAIKKLASSASKGSAAQEILSKPIHSIEDVNKLNTTVASLEGRLAKATLDGNEKSIASLTKSIETHKSYASAIDGSIKEEQRFSVVEKEAAITRDTAQANLIQSENARSTAMLKRRSILDTDRQTQLLADRALLNASAQNISAQAAQTAAVKGFSAAWVEAREAIKKAQAGPSTTLMDLGAKEIDAQGKEVAKLESITTPALGKIRGGWLSLKVGIVAATGAIGTALNFMAPWLAVIGLAVAAVSAFSDWMSTASKEIDKFNISLDTTKDSTKLLKDVAADLWSKGSEEWLTADSLVARANAMVGLSDSISATISNLKKAQLASSGWDDFWDGFLWTDSRTQKASKAIGEGITESIRLMPDSEAKKAYELKIGNILGKSGLGLKNLPKLDVSKEVLNELATADKAFSTSQANTAEAAAGGKKALDELDKAYNTLKVSMMPSDNLTKFGLGLLNVSTAMRALSKDTENAFQELLRIAKDPALAGQFSSGPKLIKQAADLQKINDQYNTQAKALKSLQEAEEKLNNSKGIPSLLPNPERSNLRNIKQLTAEEFKKELAENKPFNIKQTSNAPEIKALEESQAKLLLQKKDFAKQITDLELDSLKKGLTAIGAGFATIIQGAQLKLQGAIASTLVGEAGIKERERIALKEIDVRLASNTLTSRLILSQDRAALNMEALGAQIALSTAEEEKAALKLSGADFEALKPISSKIEKLANSLATLNIAKGILSGGSTFANYSKAAKGTDLEKDAAKRVETSAIAAGNMEAQAAAASLEKVAIKVKSSLDIITEVTRKNSKAISDTITSLDNDIKALGGANTVSTTMYFENIIQQKEAAKISQQELLIEEERLGIQKKRDTLTKAAESTGQKSAVDKAMKEEEEAFRRKVSLQKEGIDANRKTNTIQAEARQYAIDILNITREQNSFELVSSANTSKLDNSKALLENDKTLGLLLEENYIKEKAVLDIKTAQATKTQEINSLETARKLALIESSRTTGAAITSIGDTLKGPEKQKAINELTAQQVVTEGLINEKATVGKLIAESKLDTLTKTITQQSVHNTLTATQTEQMSKMVSVTESLAKIFGELGTAVGGVGQAILKMAQDDESYLLKKKTLEEDIAKAKDAKDTDKEIKSKKDLGDLDKKQTVNEISNISKVAGASKKVFSEKTAAYKILDGIEKASAAYKMAMQVKELALDFKNFAVRMGLMTQEVTAEVAKETAQFAARAASATADVSLTVSTEAAKNAAKTPGVFMSFLNWLGPWGMAAAGVAIAAVLGGGGGGAKVNTAGLTAEDMQKSQGTGQKWVDGKLVDTGFGVFGDSSAKTESIANSIEILKDNSIEGLSYDNKLLKAMEKVATSITGAATTLYKIPGLSSGSAFNTQEGTTGKKTLGWGKTTDTTILDSGIKLKGSFLDLAESAAGAATTFETVQTTVNKSSWFGLSKSSSSSTATTPGTLAQNEIDAVKNVFKDAITTFVEVGKVAGISEQTVRSKLDTTNIEETVSARGLTGTEYIKELQSVVGTVLSQGAASIFSEFKKYAAVGEDPLQTTIRIVDGFQKVNLGLKSIGSTLNTVGLGLEKFDLSEVLINNAGGLEKFMGNLKFFGDNFLTEADRLAPKQKAVTEEMARLGYSSVDTREEFKILVKGLDLTTAAGQTNYQALMNVAEGFDAVTSAAEAAAEKTRDLQLELLTAQGKTSDVLKLNREQELKEITAQSDKRIKLATYETEDLAKIKDKELALLNAQGFAYDALVRTRSAEIESLRYTGETVSDLGKAAKRTSDNLINSTKAINTAADAAKTRGLENELLTLQGNASEALLRTRQAELLTLSSVDASLKLRIWRLQDEAKLVEQRNSQEIAIYNLLGNSAAALQITREKELATLDEQLKPAQLYLYALQDEATLKGRLKTAYDKEKTAIKATIDSIGGMIKSLKDAKEAMLIGSLSPLTPAEKYAEAKRQAVSVAILATSIATTDSEIAARNDAVSKLPSVTGTFLDASKTLFASSEQYTQDFQSVLAVLDATSTILGKQKTDAEKQLDSLKSMDGYLGTIAEDTKTSADYLKDLNELLPTLISTKAAAAAAGSIAAGGVAGTLTSNSIPEIPKSYFEKYADVKTALTPYIASNGVSEAQLSAIHYAYWGYSEGRDNPGIAIDTAAAASAFDTPRDSIIAQAELAGVKYFAKGGLASGLSMVGEQGPELVDFKTPARVYSNNATNQLLSNKELIEEIRRLRNEVSQLRTEQKEQTGHLITTNYDANTKAANSIANATEQAAIVSDWNSRSKVKLA